MIHQITKDNEGSEKFGELKHLMVDNWAGWMVDGKESLLVAL